MGEDPATGALADRLLAPLVRWRDAAKAPGGAAAEPAAATELAGDPS